MRSSVLLNRSFSLGSAADDDVRRVAAIHGVRQPVTTGPQERHLSGTGIEGVFEWVWRPEARGAALQAVSKS